MKMCFPDTIRWSKGLLRRGPSIDSKKNQIVFLLYICTWNNKYGFGWVHQLAEWGVWLVNESLEALIKMNQRRYNSFHCVTCRNKKEGRADGVRRNAKTTEKEIRLYDISAYVAFECTVSGCLLWKEGRLDVIICQLLRIIRERTTKGSASALQLLEWFIQ